MFRTSFFSILARIQGHPVFHTSDTTGRPQEEPQFQLQVALKRFGTEGSTASSVAERTFQLRVPHLGFLRRGMTKSSGESGEYVSSRECHKRSSSAAWYFATSERCLEEFWTWRFRCSAASAISTRVIRELATGVDGRAGSTP